MKRITRMSIVIAIAAISSLYADHDRPRTCSNKTINGKYGVSCEGFISLMTGAPLVPFKLLGTLFYSPASASLQSNASVGGSIFLNVSATGPVTVNSDCTGTVTPTVTYAPGLSINQKITFFVLDDG